MIEVLRDGLDDFEMHYPEEDWDSAAAGQRVSRRSGTASSNMVNRCSRGEAIAQYSRTIVYLDEEASERQTPIGRAGAEEVLANMCGPLPFDLAADAATVCDRFMDPVPTATTDPSVSASDGPAATETANLWQSVEPELLNVGCSPPSSGTTLECTTMSGYALRVDVYARPDGVDLAVATHCPQQDPNQPMVFGRNWTAITADLDFAPQAMVVDSDRC